MAITLLPLDLELGDCCSVTIGMVAGALDIERTAESFQGQINILPVNDLGSVVGCEAIFRQCENQREIEMLLPVGGDSLHEHRIIISVAASPLPALDSATLAVLAPPFAPGDIGVDWDDVCQILRSGKQAILVMAEFREDVTEVLELAELALAKHDLAQSLRKLTADLLGRIPYESYDLTLDPRVMAAVFAPRKMNWMEPIGKLSSALGSFDPERWYLPSAPLISGDTAICSVLIVIPE